MLPLKSAIRLSKQFNFFVFLFFVSSLFASGQFAQAATNADLLTRIEDLQKKLDEINTQQTTILDKTRELSEKLDQVKVWARRG